MRLLDLFSGIGGFSLAATWAGIKPIQFVEINDYCQKVINKNFPGVPIHGDIKTFRGRTNSADVISGGFPCQPFSIAGKQRGSEDDRYLWPEMLRVIEEARPTWVIAENVTGIVKMELDNVLSDLENIGFCTQSIVVPACAVDAKHRRDRIWIVANALQTRLSDRNAGKNRQGTHTESSGKNSGYKWETWPSEPNVDRMASRISSALDGTLRRYGYDNANDQKTITTIDEFRKSILHEMWYENNKIESTSYGTKSRINNRSVYEMSYLRTHEKWNLGQRIEKEKDMRNMWENICSKSLKKTQNLQQQMLERIREKECNEKVGASRVDRIKGLGNAIVPQVAYQIFKAIVEVNDEVE